MNPPSPAVRLPRATELAHQWLAARLRPGDTAMDATAGNGRDTLFLARSVGPGGLVLGFDIQAEAIEETRRRCAAAGVADWVRLIVGCHSRLREHAPDGCRAVTFNLGYLPGGDKRVVTRTESTLAALDAAAALLAPGGLITAILYPGHPGGGAEAAAVEAWAEALDRAAFSVAAYRHLNRVNDPPRLLGIERL